MSLEGVLRKGKSLGKRVLFVSALATTLLVSSCGKESSPTSPVQEPLGQNEYILEDNVLEVTPENAEGISNYDPETGQITLAADSYLLEEISEGKVILSGITPETPRGLLRKVESVEGNLITTSSATLDDAMSEYNFHAEFSLTPQNKSLAGKDGIGFDIPIEEKVIYDGDGNFDTTDDQIRINGNLIFSGEVRKFDAESSFIAGDYFEFDGEILGNATLSLSTPNSFFNLSSSYKIGEIPCPAVPVGPVLIFPTIELHAGIEGDLNFSDVGFNANFSSEVNVVYDDGWKPPICTHHEGLSLISENFSADADLKVFVEPRLDLMVYTLAGANLSAKEYLRANIQTNQDPWWNAYLGIEASIGAELEFLNWEVPLGSISLFQDERRIAHADPRPENLIAILETTPNSGIAPLEVLLDGSSSTPREEITKYIFNFGDGTSYFETSTNFTDGNFDGKTTHIYGPGDFVPSLRVENGLGEINFDSGEVFVGRLRKLGFLGGFGIGASDPVFSNDGRRILCNYQGEVGEINLESNHFEKIPNIGEGIAFFDYSSDDSRIVYSDYWEGLYTINRDGTEKLKLPTGNWREWRPFWSPNDSEIIFDARDGPGASHDIKIFDYNSFQEQLFLTQAEWPAYSPDGSKIIFGHPTGMETKIEEIARDGSQRRIIFANGEYNICPSYSPDGSKIVFFAENFGPMHVLNLNDGTMRAFSFDNFRPSFPRWSPDGKEIIFEGRTLDNLNDIGILTLPSDMQESK